MMELLSKNEKFLIPLEFGNIVLIEASAGIGHDVLLYSTIANILKNNLKVFIVTATKTKKQIVSELLQFGLLEESILNNLFLVTTLPEKMNNVYHVELSKLFTVSDAIKRLLNICRIGSIDLILSLLIFEDSKTVFKFIDEIARLVKYSKTLIMLPIDVGVADKRTLSMFENIADIVVEMKEIVRDFKIIRGIRIKKISGIAPSSFYSYNITPNGIIIGDKIE